MAWGIWIAVALAWVAVAACWLIRRGAYRDREAAASAMRRTIPGAGSEPEEHLSRAARYARQTFGPEGR